MTRGVNPPEPWGKGHSPPPAIPLYERAPEFRQTLLEASLACWRGIWPEVDARRIERVR